MIALHEQDVSGLSDWKPFTIEPMKHMFYYFHKGVLFMTANEMFERLSQENKKKVIREIESLIESQSENRSPSDSPE